MSKNLLWIFIGSLLGTFIVAGALIILPGNDLPDPPAQTWKYQPVSIDEANLMTQMDSHWEGRNHADKQETCRMVNNDVELYAEIFNDTMYDNGFDVSLKFTEFLEDFFVTKCKEM